MDAAHDERYSHHKDHEGHEGFGYFAHNFVLFVCFVVKIFTFGCGSAVLGSVPLNRGAL
jgi:hypothetical protein